MTDDSCRTYFTRDTITDVFDAAEWLRRLRDHFAFMVEQASDSSGDHVARDSWLRWRDLLDKAAGETHACARQMLRMPPDLSMYVACVAHPIHGVPPAQVPRWLTLPDCVIDGDGRLLSYSLHS